MNIKKYCKSVLKSTLLFSCVLTAVQPSYEEMVRGYRTQLAKIDNALTSFVVDKRTGLIQEAHAQLLKSYRVLRTEIEGLDKELSAIRSSRAVQDIIDDLLEGISDQPTQARGVERLYAIRSRLSAEAAAIRGVQDRLSKAINRPLALNKKALITLSDTIGNSMIVLVNTIINDVIDRIIARGS